MKLHNIKEAMEYINHSKETFILDNEIARYTTPFYSVKFFKDGGLEVKDHIFGIIDEYTCLDNVDSILNSVLFTMGVILEYIDIYKHCLDYQKIHKNIYVGLVNNKDLATLKDGVWYSGYETYITVSNEFIDLECYYTIDGGWIIHYGKDQYIDTNSKRFKKDLDNLLSGRVIIDNIINKIKEKELILNETKYTYQLLEKANTNEYIVYFGDSKEYIKTDFKFDFNKTIDFNVNSLMSAIKFQLLLTKDLLFKGDNEND